MNAAYRVGTPQSAHALAKFAASEGSADWIRVEALNDLANWAEPLPLDRVMNMYWPLPKRDEAAAREAAGFAVSHILHPASDAVKVPDKVRVAAVSLIRTLKINDTAVLFELVSGKSYPVDLRAEALSALADRNDPKLAEATTIALGDAAPRFRQAAIRALPKLPDASPRLQGFMTSGNLGEQQAALAALAEVRDPSAESLLSQSLDKLIAGQWKPELALDLSEAAQKRNTPELTAKLDKFALSLSKSDPLAEYRVSLVGGNAENGHAVMERSDASCIRCHTVHKQGGIVGPVLDGVGSRQTREYLLESIVYPNAKIAPGFETAVVKLKDGKVLTGIVKMETARELTLVNVDGQVIKAPTAEIESRSRGVSAMPEGFAKTLSKRDLRDLVEFLAELKK